MSTRRGILHRGCESLSLPRMHDLTGEGLCSATRDFVVVTTDSRAAAHDVDSPFLQQCKREYGPVYRTSTSLHQASIYDTPHLAQRAEPDFSECSGMIAGRSVDSPADMRHHSPCTAPIHRESLPEMEESLCRVHPG